MADINEFTVQGTVASFNNAVRTANLDNEEKAVCHVTLNVQTNQKGENGYYIEHPIEVVAFKKTAIALSKFAKPKAGLILQGSLGASRKMMRNGQAVMTTDGKEVYSGISLIVNPYGIHPQRGTGKASGTDSAPANATNMAAPAVDPLAMVAPAASAPAPAAAPAATGTDGFSFGGSEDNSAWPF